MKHRDLEAEIIELPYEDSNFTLTIFYPNKCGGLTKLSQKLNTFDFESLGSALTKQTVHLALPKFYIDYKIDNIKHALKMVSKCQIQKKTTTTTPIRYFAYV